MDDKKINYLVSQSYRSNLLIEEKVDAVKKILKRSDFKKYIKMLKKRENEKNVIVISPFECADKKMFEKLFPDKNIVFKTDPSLITGVKIIDKDMIYELNLRDTLNNIVDHVGKIYD